MPIEALPSGLTAADLTPGAMTAARDRYERRIDAALAARMPDFVRWVRVSASADTNARTAPLLTYADVASRWQRTVASMAPDLGPDVAEALAQARLPHRLWEVLDPVLHRVNAVATRARALALIEDITSLTDLGSLTAAAPTDADQDLGLGEVAIDLLDTWDLVNNLTALGRWLATSSFNRNTIEGFRLLGVEAKRWVSHHDTRVRDTHLTADGQVMPLESSFLVGGEWLFYPGDPNGTPKEIANCRCVMSAASWLED